MKNHQRPLRRILVLILLVGPVFVSTSPNSPLHLARANPSIIRVPGSFTTIQDAVNAANPGDTILVSSGTYRENVVVTKSLSILRASLASTIIDASASGPGVNITSTSSVYLSGFHITHTSIFDNGIDIFYSTDITIAGNRIDASSQTNGIFIVSSNSSTLNGNIVTGNLYGVTIIGGFGNLIQRDNITGNPSGDIYIRESTGNRVVNNTLAKYLTGLMLWNNADGNIVSRNIIANDTSEGISLKDSPSGGNLFLENRVENNRDNSNTLAVNIQNSAGNRFYHNKFANNAGQVFGVLPTDLTLNFWDNATGLTSLKSDPKIMFVESNGNLVWDSNETVVYDRDTNGMFDPGDVVIASINGMIPSAGTVLQKDTRIKFVDLNNDNTWERGEPVVLDADNNNVFDAGEPAIAGVGGNFWDTYAGLDNGNNGFAGDGIGDTMIPTPCPNGGLPCTSSTSGPKGVDWYPLMVPWKPSIVNVTATARPLGGFEPLQVSFAGSASGGLAPYTFSWNFGDGTAAKQQNTTHTYSFPGQYIATLTVNDTSGAMGSKEVSISVLSPTGNLTLIVLDENMLPLQASNVSLLTTPLGQVGLSALTNKTGIAAFSRLVPGIYLVQASSSGFRASEKNVTVVRGLATTAQLVLARVPPPNSFLVALVVGGGVGAIAGIVLIFLFFRRKKKRKTHAEAIR